MNIHLREAKPSDADLLSQIAFESKSHWGYSAEFMEACSDELRVSAQKILSESLVYQLGENADHAKGEIFGFCAIKHISDDEAELEALFVKPTYIGKGVGKALFDHVTAYAKKRGYKLLTINSDPNSEAFYLAAGAVRVGEEESGSIAGRYLPIVQYDLVQC